MRSDRRTAINQQKVSLIKKIKYDWQNIMSLKIGIAKLFSVLSTSFMFTILPFS